MSGIKRNSSGGFTLIELSIGLLIWVLISVSIAQVFQSGLRLWKKADKDAPLYQEARGALDQLASEIRSAMDVPGVGWKTSAGGDVQFASVLTAYSHEATHEPVERIFKITYLAKPNSLTRVRQELTPAGLRTPVETVMTVHPSHLTWEYAYASSKGVVQWQDEWKAAAGNVLPCGVRVNLTLIDDHAEPRKFTRTIFLPTSEVLPWAT